MSKLSPNFTLEEFTFSQTAVRHGVDNDPSPEIVAKLTKTAHRLELVRAFLGNRAVRVSSAFRSPECNALVGGSSNSSHCSGEAVDFTVAGMTPREVATKIAASSLEFDQLILEGVSSAKPDGAWVHIGYGDKNRQEILTMKPVPGKKPKYEKGLTKV